MNINNKFFKIILAFAIFFSTTATDAFEPKSALIQKDDKLTLSDCIEIALDNSPNVRQAAYNYKIAKNNVSIAKTNYFPIVGVGTGYYYTKTHTDKNTTNTNYYSVSTTLNQLIYGIVILCYLFLWENEYTTWAHLPWDNMNDIK